MRNLLKCRNGFTLTELSVVIAVGAILASVLVADLSQARTKLLQQACAANLKQWGMAIDLYSQDYDGAYFLSSQFSAFTWDDANGPNGMTNVYLRYLGGGDPLQRIRPSRICPFVAARMTQEQLTGSFVHTYSMPIPQVRKPPSLQVYAALQPDASGNYHTTLKSVPNPATYLLIIDSSGHTLNCGPSHLTAAVSGVPTGDNTKALDRHGAAVNCLFGDFHVELVTSNRIAQQDMLNCGVAAGNPWFNMN